MNRVCCCLCRERSEMVEVGDPTVVARKVQKADREKIRRDRLNDHFHQLGTVIGTLFNHLWIHTQFDYA